MNRRLVLYAAPAAALVLLAAGTYDGLLAAPPDRMMGEVYRIMFVHVPAAWMAFVAYTVGLGASIAFLWRADARADALAHSSIEVGVVFNLLLLVTGSIWGRPTWGVWWSWDPRLTTAAIMLFAFSGYLTLRRFVDDPERRATWAAVVAILAAAVMPLVWFSVRWWNSLHQLQSSPATVAAPMVLALRLNAFAYLAVYISLVQQRYAVALAERQHEDGSLPPLAAP